MTVLVLGASGFIGSWTVRSLVASGVETAILARRESDLWRLEGVEPLTTVRANREEWPRHIARLEPSVIVSLDWEGVAGYDRDAASQWSNPERQRAVLEAASSAGTKRFVGVGSHAEYGPKTDRIAEGETTEPRTEYGKAKLAAMEGSRAFCHARGLEWVWARVFSTYGPLDNAHWLLPLIADALIADVDIALTTGEQTWSYLYGSDAGDAMRVLATHPDAQGIYNVGNPLAPVLRQTIEAFARHLGSLDHLRFGVRPFEIDPVMRLEPDVTRLESLGWSVRVPLDEGLTDSAAWLRGEVLTDPLAPDRSLPSRPV